ncbi:MAG: 4-(cytidine 5'-diphospho)-2-C-methyl-D-erythritol kinase [Rhizobiales bacterium]|nr:4-(cytidine 5'-diphospho)-2-C-methyl-D-erythritol kinase [Hyphomicrobiales bacterium]
MTNDQASITCAAPAKVNLSLEVLGRRTDGYHVLQSFVVFTRLGDVVTVEAAADISLTITGPFAESLSGEGDNLVLRAAHALRAVSGSSAGARITLEKNLPVASGIGGGSADAAATLKALSQLWKTRLSSAETFRLALSLGADVPVCMAGAPSMMGGIGETLVPLEMLPSFALLLVNPNKPVSTGDVFSRLAAAPVSLPLPELVAPQFEGMEELVTWLKGHPNDLERPARQLAPDIAEVITEIGNAPEVMLARMSGSGATCFGICRDRIDANVIAHQIRKRYPGWWVATTDALTSAAD